jgi:hypothetical protein
MGLHKILKIVSGILGVIGVILWILIIVKGDAAVTSTGEGVEPLFYVGYIVLAIVLLLVVIYVLKGIFAGNIKKTLISIGLFVAVVVVSYVLASGSLDNLPLVDGVPVTESTSKWVGTGLNAFYILAIAAIGAMVFSGIKKITK